MCKEESVSPVIIETVIFEGNHLSDSSLRTTHSAYTGLREQKIMNPN